MCSVVLASLALSCCGGTDADSPAKARDTSAARRAVLLISDLPTGWGASFGGAGQGPSDCEAINTARHTTSARATSDAFNHRPTGQISHAVYVFPDEAAATTAFHALATPDNVACVGSQVQGVLHRIASQGVQVGATTTSALHIDPVGVESGGGHIAIRYTTGDATRALGADLLLIREGRGVSVLLFIDERNAFDRRLRARLASVSDRRLRAALGA